MSRFTLLLVMIFMTTAALKAQGDKKIKTVNLEVKIEGSVSSSGKLQLELYDSEGDWLKKETKVLYIDLTKENDKTFVLEGLPAGTYAIAVIHDQNNNGELDMGMMGPTEKYGFSNNARGNFGPASFSQAAMTIETDSQITIKL